MSRGQDTYSIRQVIELTGLSEFTLRAWETRYEAFKPRRTASGRRVYSHADLQKAILLRELTLRHHRIRHIAQLSPTDLRGLLEVAPKLTTQSMGKFQLQIERILKALSLQNWDGIESELRQVESKEKPKVILTELIAPLVSELGQMVGAGTLSISQEHIFSAILKERLYVLRDKAKKLTRSSRFVVATPEGDFHELGILVAHAIISNSGYKSLYLGPNAPKKDLCETALRFGASHILIGSTVSKPEGAKEDLLTYIHFLDNHLGREVSLWLGGRNSLNRAPGTDRKIKNFYSLKELDAALKEEE